MSAHGNTDDRDRVCLPAARPLGRTGMHVSCLGLGTVKLGRNTGVKYPGHFSLPSDQQTRELLATARGSGINLLDTAPAYGNAEERLGRLLTDRKSWVICSKTGEEFVAGKSSFNFSASHTRHSVERSLQRLRTDYLDIVLVHSDGNDLHILEQTDCFETLARLKEQGLIRSFGLSGKTVAGGLRALEHADLVMVTYNREETGEQAVIKRALALGKGVLIKKAFASGHALQASGQSIQHHLEFALNEPGVGAVVIGTINTTHLRDNVVAATAAVSTD
jgi:aryl-alcohol dehydrogenase-like predicted oxidoreductase